ncbi:hypothetical protein [Kaistia terrae]|uniref:Uncharacterized protein n=1 Tax=Kaistia terrae TaxID=537017 RepID=A0ABW0PZ69_9HYPH|nr:hypothetical protein [Kaistia terrae]MCX5580480.1 hypothetical protein [Kaistia terrae]
MDLLETIRRGSFLYDGFHPTEVRIVLSPTRYGTGDYEDPPEISDDVQIATYYVEYGSTYEKGVFHAGGGGFDSFEEAASAVAAAVGESLVWSAD